MGKESSSFFLDLKTFNSRVSAILRIDLEPSSRLIVEPLSEERPEKDWTLIDTSGWRQWNIKSIRLEAEELIMGKEGSFVSSPLPKSFLMSPLIDRSQIVLCSDLLPFVQVEFGAPNGADFFTVDDILTAIEETELIVRPQTEWFGGVDTHHVFFEGLRHVRDNVYSTGWGS